MLHRVLVHRSDPAADFKRTLSRATAPVKTEPRWPVALAIFTLVWLLRTLPDRIMIVPPWVIYLMGLIPLIPVIGVAATGGRKPGWLRLERAAILLAFALAAVATVVNLINLVTIMIRRAADVDGVQLLSSSIGVWVTNVIMFTLLYWQIDRDGPEARLTPHETKPDWLFPQESAPSTDVAPGWHPTFVDYLYLGFSTATAFSTTDAMPLTARAKLLMMLESSLSLTTIAMVASRAINILGS